MIKPQLADNWDQKKQAFPCWWQPKIDGVRGLYLTGSMTGRSLKNFANKAATIRFSQPQFKGLDGEFAAGSPTSLSLCRDTTSQLTTKAGTAEGLVWHVFDLVTEETVGMPYEERYELLEARVKELADPQVALVPYVEVTSLEQVLSLDSDALDAGFEGSILRNPKAPYKPGRPSSKTQELMRIKTFIDAEFLITKVVQGRKNNNEATTNELGRTERSTHAENQEPNGMCGGLIGNLLADVLCPTTGAVLFKEGQEVLVSPGALTHPERKSVWEDHSLAVGKIGKLKTFPRGAKDKPRFPIFTSFRDPVDMSK